MNTSALIPPSPIKRAEQYLDVHIKNADVVRHAAATQGLLSSWGVAEQVQVASLIIPLIREYVLDEETLALMFGVRAMQIARTAMRFGLSVTQTSQQERSVYFMRKLRNLYICAYTDVESVLLCVADYLAITVRVDNVDDHDYRPWAEETLTVFVPLVEMLGMWTTKKSMADLALHFYDAGLQSQFVYYLSTYYARHSSRFDEIKRKLDHVLGNLRIAGTVEIHETTPASLYRRYETSIKRGRPFNPSDPGILRVEVVVERDHECYHVIGIIHNIWSPSASTPIKDYIASPRYNGYRSLITTVNIEDEAVEFCIMTEAMQDVNARGVLTRRRVRNAWWSENARRSRPQTGIRKTTRLDDNISVFSPSGEVYELKRGSTAIDFAFKVHSELGPYARRFYINGEMRTYNAVIHHRDLVEIEYDQSIASVRPEWEGVARTSTARIGIRRFLRGKLSPVHRGRAIIDRIMERESDIYNMRFPADQIENWLEKATFEDYELTSKDELYTKIADGHIAPDNIVAKIFERELSIYVRVPDEVHRKHMPQVRFARSWMQAPKHEKFNRTQRILPGVEIVGRLYVSKSEENELFVHRADSIHAPQLDDPNTVPLHWSSGNTEREAVQVTLSGSAKPLVPWAVMNQINQVMKELPDSDMMLYAFNTEIVQGMTRIEFTLDVADSQFIALLDEKLTGLRSLGTISSFKIWELFPGQRKLIAGLSDRRQRNPYTTHHVKDSMMFFGRREELHRIVSAMKDGIQFIIIHGHKRVGKTSLMYHLAEHVIPGDDEVDVIPILFDTLKVAPVTEESFAAGLIQEAAAKIMRGLKREQRQKLNRIARTVSEDPLGVLVLWVSTAEKYLNGTRLYFMVDEFTAVEDAYQHGDITRGFFQRMHHIVDHGEVAFLLCIHNHVLRELTHRLGDMNQRALLVPVDMMESRDARMLVRAPLERFYTYDEGVEDEILRLTNCHPFYIQLLCGEIFTGMAVADDAQITHNHLLVARSKLFTSAFQSFAHFKDAPGGYGRETLEVIAFLTGRDNTGWANPDDIAHLMKEHHNLERQQVEGIVKALHEAGAIRRRAPDGRDLYQIRVNLLHAWSVHGTGFLMPPVGK
ncbi:MAG: HD domain-containing protein [Chloroflexota bacterium]